MSKRLPLADFRAVRHKLEPHEFAISEGEDVAPTQLIDRKTWAGITHLPDDVAIRTSDHNGHRLELLYSLWGDWIMATGDPEKPDELFDCMLDAGDAFQCTNFLFLHGYYRAAMAELRVALELVMIGAYGNLKPNDPDYIVWKNSGSELGFTRFRKRAHGMLRGDQGKWLLADEEFPDRTFQQLCKFTQAPDSAPPPREKLRRDVIAMMEGVTKITSAEYPPERISEALFAANEATVAQVMLINEYNLPDRDKQMPMVFLSSRFPVAYVAALDRLVHRDWSVACFTKTAENHSMWSTYANGHRGVCLMFKTTPNETGVPALVIERVTGVSGTKEATTYISSEVSHELNAVRYTAQYPAIDFFRSLGSISEMHMNNFWYRGDNGAFSECRDAVYADHDAWRKGYWQTFGESTLYKTPEWAHEEEYRIVAHSGFDMSDPIKRKLKYRFEDLAGIVFGARTDIEDKLKIMRIIDAKCAKARRSDFKFFEVRYLHTESRFQLFSLDLLKIQWASANPDCLLP